VITQNRPPCSTATFNEQACQAAVPVPGPPGSSGGPGSVDSSASSSLSSSPPQEPTDQEITESRLQPMPPAWWATGARAMAEADHRTPVPGQSFPKVMHALLDPRGSGWEPQPSKTRDWHRAAAHCEPVRRGHALPAQHADTTNSSGSMEGPACHRSDPQRHQNGRGRIQSEMHNPFEIFLTSLVSIRKPDGSTFERLKCSVKDNKVEIHDATLPVDCGDVVIHHLPSGREEIYDVASVSFQEGIAGHVPGWLVLNCVRRNSSMPVFTSQYAVTLIRDAGTPEEQRWETRMGGDLTRKALFYLDDRVRTGDEIHADFFDEPRIVSRVNPCTTMTGISHWEAEMVPQSDWRARQRSMQPSIVVSGQGARVNLGSVDRSVQQF
jgi:hypothetical protein